MAHYSAIELDRAFARSSMPRAREVTVNNTTGFAYEFTCEYGTHYVLFAWFDGLRYKVKLVSPEYERGETGHATHLYHDGTLCLDPSGLGLPTLADAYAKSVVWATGHTIYRETGKFQLNVSNR